MAETTGFEPVKGYKTLNDLANRRFQPLSHVSAFCRNLSEKFSDKRKRYSSRSANFVKFRRIIRLKFFQIT